MTATSAVGYARLIDQQGDWQGIAGRTGFIFAFLLTLAVIGVLGTLARPTEVRATAAAACAGGLLPLGVAAMFSIGLVLVAAGVLSLVA